MTDPVDPAEGCYCGHGAYHHQGGGWRAVPIERLRAVICLLCPEEMTPTARRVLSMLADEYDTAPKDPTDD